MFVLPSVLCSRQSSHLNSGIKSDRSTCLADVYCYGIGGVGKRRGAITTPITVCRIRQLRSPGSYGAFYNPFRVDKMITSSNKSEELYYRHRWICGALGTRGKDAAAALGSGSIFDGAPRTDAPRIDREANGRASFCFTTLRI